MRMGGASNRSLLNIFLKTKEDWRALRENNFSFFLSVRVILLKNLSKIVQFL
jgi:glycosyltransferase